VRSILIASLFSYVALAASILSPDQVFNFLVNASGAIMLFIYLLIAMAQLKLRAGFEASAPDRLQVRMWLYPYGTYATMAGMAGVLVLMALSPTHAIELWTSVVVTAVCLAGYWLRMRFGPRVTR
jgi:L-asparagine transporter-like permease